MGLKGFGQVWSASGGCKGLICRLYKDRATSSLNTVCVRTFLTCNKPEEMPATLKSAKFHILRALSQAFIWINAHIPFWRKNQLR